MGNLVNAVLMLIFAPIIFALAATGIGMFVSDPTAPAIPVAMPNVSSVPASDLIAEIDALTEELRKRNAELAEHNARLEALISKIQPTHK